LERYLRDASPAADLDTLRGAEGEAAALYFSMVPKMLRVSEPDFARNGRNRRPPLDPVNALFSLLYALLSNDCVSAVEAAGLDSQIGFLHALRPGRPTLALDLWKLNGVPRPPGVYILCTPFRHHRDDDCEPVLARG
jgi:CRISP-associated protein Cas1